MTSYFACNDLRLFQPLNPTYSENDLHINVHRSHYRFHAKVRNISIKKYNKQDNKFRDTSVVIFLRCSTFIFPVSAVYICRSLLLGCHPVVVVNKIPYANKKYHYMYKRTYYFLLCEVNNISVVYS